jgi:hypothetical protein
LRIEREQIQAGRAEREFGDKREETLNLEL